VTVQQMATVKRWHQIHRRNGGMEIQVWDLVLTCWLLGWVGLPAAVLMEPVSGLAICLLLYLMPNLYVALRRRLHRTDVLRCDWLHSASQR
jgi:hypothetical protein